MRTAMARYADVDGAVARGYVEQATQYADVRVS